MSSESKAQPHQLRISIDFKAIKEHQFTAQLYLKYSYIPDLSIKNFRSAPTIPLNQAKVETSLDNCFNTYYFEATKDDLADKINKQFRIELWHNDRLKKDVLLGVCTLQLKNILSLPLRQIQNSYARVLDAYVPIDELDEDQSPIKQIGSLRVLIYLEDLGPVTLLKQKGFDIKNFIDDQDIHRNVQDPHLPSQKPQNDFFQGNEARRMELNQLQYKVVWELQTWKKAQQAKTKLTLKQKQIEFWTNLSQQQKKSDLEKEKQFKKIEANLNLLEGKLKSKLSELIKRQQKIVIAQQQLQTKMNEVSKQLLQKDEEIDRAKKRNKDERATIIKEKSQLDLEISKLRAQNARLRVQLEQAKKQDQKSPLNILKNQLNHKNLQIRQLTTKCEKYLQLKQEFKLHYEKMKSEVINLKGVVRQKDEGLSSAKYEYSLLQNNYRHLEENLNTLKHQIQRENNRNYANNNYHSGNPANISYENLDQEFLGEREKLIRQRQRLLDSKNYDPSDDLIKQFDKQIAACR